MEMTPVIKHTLEELWLLTFGFIFGSKMLYQTSARVIL
jgi:hypothetical protein